MASSVVIWETAFNDVRRRGIASSVECRRNRVHRRFEDRVHGMKKTNRVQRRLYDEPRPGFGRRIASTTDFESASTAQPRGAHYVIQETILERLRVNNQHSVNRNAYTAIGYHDCHKIRKRAITPTVLVPCHRTKQLYKVHLPQVSPITICTAGLGGSVGCAVRLETRRSRVQLPPRSATFFRGDWSWNIFYGHSLPSADSRRAVVSFWRKNVHNTG